MSMASKRKKKEQIWSFLWLPDRHDCDDLRVRSYRAANLKTACDKMLRFLENREEQTALRVEVDEDVVEINGRLRKEHFIGDHPLRDYC